MKVFLLSPPYVAEYMRNGRCDYVSWSRTQWYPIWLAYCGALLEKNGHEVELIDAPAARLSQKDVFKRIVAFRPDMLVVYSSTKSQENDIFFAEQIKDARNCYVVFVGPYVSCDPEAIATVSRKIDACVQGEFEYPVLELAQHSRMEDIRNLVWRREGRLVINETRDFLSREELDQLPFVTDFYRRRLNLKYYRVPSEPYPFVDLFTGRGCVWGRCIFCLWPHSFIKGSVYNTRSVGNVIDELRFVRKAMPFVKAVFFQDDTLPAWRALELSNAILQNDIKISWSCYARADLEFSVLKRMKESGCRVLHVGYESKSNPILKNIGKGLTNEEMTEFTLNAHKAGLRIHGDFLLGLPGETEQTIQETIDWARLLNPQTAQFLSPSIYAKTPLHTFLSRGESVGETAMVGDLPVDKIARWVKRAYRQFYFRKGFIKRVIAEPNEYLFCRFPQACRSFFRIFLMP